MANNIFGVGKPQIKGDGDPDSTTVTLYHLEYLERNFAEPQTYKGDSPITGFRNFGLVGDYSHFQFVINAFQYTVGTEGYSTIDFIKKMRGYHGKFVYFRPHKDSQHGAADNGNGIWMKDSSDNDMKYFITVVPIALEGVPYSTEMIQLLVDMNSQGFTDITKILDEEPV